MAAGKMTMDGYSAGANLGVATALRLRSRGETRLIRAIVANYGYFTPGASDAGATHSFAMSIAEVAQRARCDDATLLKRRLT